MEAEFRKNFNGSVLHIIMEPMYNDRKFCWLIHLDSTLTFSITKQFMIKMIRVAASKEKKTIMSKESIK